MIALKNLKYLGLNLTKYLYDPNTELQTIVEDDLNEEKVKLHSFIRKPNRKKMPISKFDT